MFECCVVDVVIYFSTGICFLRHFSQTHQNHQNPKLQTMFEEQTSKGKKQATSNKQQATNSSTDQSVQSTATCR
jgi:hypothetical protein